LNLGSELNTDVDTALAKKRAAKFAALEQQRKAREALPPRKRDPKLEPEGNAPIDSLPKPSKTAAKAAQKQATQKARKILQKQIDNAKELELQLIREMEEIKERGKQPLKPVQRAALDAEYTTLRNQLATKVKHREEIFEKIDELEITPYDRARAFSYSGASGEEVASRARVFVEVPGQPKKLMLTDEMSGKPIKKPSIDHVVSIDEMVLMDGWNKLRKHEQQALLSRVDNLRMMEKGANSSKGGKRWANWREGRAIYGEKVWRKMIEEESRLRRAIQEKITEILAGRGQRP
jgi:hypothetical protein